MKSIIEALNSVELFKRGGSGIYIKPENRGKFTALKKRTGKSASWFKAHGTPAQKKMATFALNAKKWKHLEGGIIKAQAGLDTDLLNFTKSFETFSPEVITVHGQKLIGWGSANPELIAKGKITQEEADNQIAKDYNNIEAILKRRIQNWEKLSLGTKRALLETAYNVGVSKLINKSPNLMNALDSGVTDGVELAKYLDHSSSENNWLGVRSAARRAMARDAYNWNPPKVDKYGRALDSNKVVGRKDWKSSPYYFMEKPNYSEWIKTVNPEYSNTDNYNLESAFNNLPFEELEMWRMNPETNHLPSGVELPNGDFEYLKSATHPTIMHELIWENGSPEGRKWRSQFYPDKSNWPFIRLKRKPNNYVENPKSKDSE